MDLERHRGRSSATLLVMLLAGTHLPAQPAVRIVLGPASIRIGVDPRTETEEFGLVEAALILPNGAAVVSDRVKQRLVFITPTGRGVRVVGRAGSGPGEMKEPSSLAVFDSGVVVLDRALARLSFFNLTTTGLRYHRSISVRRIPDAVCGYQKEYVSLRYDPSRRTILHRLTASGEESSDFGSPLFEASDRLNSVSTQGRVVCLPDLGMVIVAPSFTSEVRSYAVTGSLLWRVSLDSLLPPEVKEVAGGGISYAWFPRGIGKSHIGITAVRLDAEYVLVQYGLRIRNRRGYRGEDFAQIESRILRLRDGQEVGRQRDLPVIHAAGSNKVLTAGEEPEPWVEMRSYELRRMR
jgi:hypothetical protein